MSPPPANAGLADGVAIAIDVGVWGAWSLLVGYVGHRWPRRTFEREHWWSRLGRVERGRGFYARVLRIHTWKDWLPELGGLFPGGFAKRAITRSRVHRQRFIVETRRAEAVHWAVFWAWPIFALWNPWWAVLVMLAYAAAANLPCVAVQRYNRGRLLDVERRRTAARDACHKIPTGCRDRSASPWSTPPGIPSTTSPTPSSTGSSP